MSINGVSPSVYLSDMSDRDQIWDCHRASALYVQFMYSQASEFESYASRMHQCAGMLQFGFRSDPDPDQSPIVLKRAIFCRVRYCPICQWRRSMLWRAKFFQNLSVLEDGGYSKAPWIFLTLTVRNCEVKDLKSTLKHMNASWRRLVKKVAFLNATLGYIRTTEVTLPANSKMAHPHFHCMIMVKPSYFKNHYISQKNWSLLWQDALEVDYDVVVDVKRIKGGLKQGVLETLKYSVKPADMLKNVDWFLELTRQTHKMRFVATGGCLKDVFKDDFSESNQDLISLDDDKNQEDDGRRISFGFNRDHLRYVYLPKRTIGLDDLIPPSAIVKSHAKRIKNVQNHPYFIDDFGLLRQRKFFDVTDEFGNVV